MCKHFEQAIAQLAKIQESKEIPQQPLIHLCLMEYSASSINNLAYQPTIPRVTCHMDMFKHWLRTYHPEALLVPVERTTGSRQDLAYEGAAAVYWNRRLVPPCH